MIADYVNDQIDVVSRAFLGLSVACARCHDHKFDPISTEDYYALAGIFFSTRLIPGPVPGNTPLVRVAAPVAGRAREGPGPRGAPTSGGGPSWSNNFPMRPTAPTSTFLRHLVAEKTAPYLVAAAEYRQASPDRQAPPLAETARTAAGSDENCWPGSSTISTGSQRSRRSTGTRPSATQRPERSPARRSRRIRGELQQDLAALADRQEKESACSPSDNALARSSLIRLRADDPYLVDRRRRPGHALAQSLRPASGRQAGSARAEVR